MFAFIIKVKDAIHIFFIYHLILFLHTLHSKCLESENILASAYLTQQENPGELFYFAFLFTKVKTNANPGLFLPTICK